MCLGGRASLQGIVPHCGLLSFSNFLQEQVTLEERMGFLEILKLPDLEAVKDGSFQDLRALPIRLGRELRTSLAEPIVRRIVLKRNLQQ